LSTINHPLTGNVHVLLLISPPPPRSTLFPYTTLFRSRWSARRAAPAWSSSTPPTWSSTGGPWMGGTPSGTLSWSSTASGRWDARSEEHTSELQSQSNLVCRLLLEKKNENKTN